HPLVKTTAALLGRVTRLAMLADDSDLEGHETRMRGARAAWRRVGDEIDEYDEAVRSQRARRVAQGSRA
ncbi:MAG: hypothetical protein ACM4D3_24660, partial [Candidatus Sericytochromatia bacterium]